MSHEEIQKLIDSNQFVNGTANETSVVEGTSRVLFLSPEGLKHILGRHQDEYAPGSLFNAGADYPTLIKSFIDDEPSEVDSRGWVKWLAYDVGQAIGSMGVKKGDSEEVAGMVDYQMPDSRSPETVKIAAGEREPTSLINLIMAPMGSLSDGREVFSIITMFPGGNSIDGVEMPMNRNDFASLGFYFVLPADSPML